MSQSDVNEASMKRQSDVNEASMKRQSDVNQTSMKRHSKLILKDTLTPFQKSVFEYLEKNEGKYLSVTQIQEALSNDGIKLHFNTAKRCIKALLKYKAISIKKRRKIGKSGFMIIEITKHQSVTMPDKSYLDFMNEDYDPEKDYSIDKSVYEKWTDEDYNDFSEKKATSMMAKHPELRYWTEKGLTIKQIDKWCSDFEIDNANMCRNLKFCAYDLRINKKECDSNGEPIKKVISYFYSSLKKNYGFYPKPENYKSHREILEERNNERIVEREKEIKRLRESRLRRENLDHAFAFEKMLAETDSDLYKKCLDKVFSFTKTSPRQDGMLFKMQMCRAYGEIHDLEEFTYANLGKFKDNPETKETS